jgi:hypothetical protein
MGVLGVFYTLKKRASVLEHSIDLISTALTESDLIQEKYAGGQVQRYQMARWRTEEGDAVVGDSRGERRRRR